MKLLKWLDTLIRLDYVMLHNKLKITGAENKSLTFLSKSVSFENCLWEAEQGSHLPEHYITMSKVRWTTEGFSCCDIKVAHIISIHIPWLELERIHPTIRATEDFILQGAWMMEGRKRLPLMTSQIPN